MLTIFLTAFTIIAILYYILNTLSFIISVIGSTVTILAISWQLTIRIRKYVARNESINSYKKAIIITGCDTGFGNRLAFKLNSKGFMVYATVLDTQSDGSLRLQSSCVFPKAIHVLRMDVRSEQHVRETYEYVRNHLEKSGHQLFGLVNNAGIQMTGPLEFGSLETYQTVFDVNVFGLVRVTRTFLPLIRQSKGRIVNVSSLGGRFTVPYAGIYCMSKHAVNSFTDALRREMQKFGVSVSLVMPCSPFATDMCDDSQFCRAIDNAWNNSDEAVKQVYDRKFLDNCKNFILNLNKNKSNNLDLVVDSMIDALTSNCPKISYSVTGDCTSYLLVLFIDYLPNQLIDKIMAHMIRKL